MAITTANGQRHLYSHPKGGQKKCNKKVGIAIWPRVPKAPSLLRERKRDNQQNKKKKGSTIEDWTEIWFLRMRNGLLIPILSYFPSSFSSLFFCSNARWFFSRLFSMCLVLGAILKIQRKYAAKFLHNVFRAPSLSLRPKHFPISTHCCGFPCEASYFFLRQQLLLA